MNKTLITAMLEDAKQVNKRAKERDGKTQYLKQNLASDYNMGGRDSKPQTKQIIKMALQGKNKDYICKCMALQGYTRTQTLAVLHRHEDKILKPTYLIIKKC
jgi:hypothetical protein